MGPDVPGEASESVSGTSDPTRNVSRALPPAAYNPDLCPDCRYFSKPTEAEIAHYGADCRGTCGDIIAGTRALTCDIRDLSVYGTAQEQERCRVARGGKARRRKGHGPPPPPGAASGKPRFVDIAHGAYHPRLCPTCPHYRRPTHAELETYGPALRGVCLTGTCRTPERYLIYRPHDLSRDAANRDKNRCWNTRHIEIVRAKGRDRYRMRRTQWRKDRSRWMKSSATKGRSISPNLRFQVLQRDGYRCVYCGRSSKDVALEVDHVVPVASGGKTEIGNLVSACWECNAGKKTLPAYCGVKASVPPVNVSP